MADTKVKSDGAVDVGANIRRIRLAQGVKQIEVVRQLQLRGFTVTKETMVKWEHGKQHLTAGQLKAIREILHTSYEELLK